MKWLKAVGLPLLYLAAVIWATRPPPPTYVSDEKIVVNVTDAGTPTLLHSPPPVYPAAALAQNVEGTVRLRVSIDDAGQVAKVEPVGGPKALVAAAVDAVKQWQFTAVAAETEIQVPFLLWHSGPHKVETPEPLQRAPAFAGAGRHGTVRVVATVDETGRVESAKAVTGPKRLLEAAEKNLRRWTFRPQLEDGKPARGTFVTDVVF